MTIEPGSILDLRSPRYAHLKAAAIDAWVNGREYTHGAFARAIARLTGEDADAVAGNLTYYLRQLEARGQYVSQPAKFGAKGLTKAVGRPTSPLTFNWSTASDPAAATLRAAVEPYLADPAIAVARKRALRSALRFHLSLPEQCPDHRILAACERVPARRLYGLPRAVKDGALQAPKPLSRRTAKNLAGAVRHALRYSAEHDKVPLVFPSFVEEDDWAKGLERFWPLPEKGRASAAQLARRRAWYAFAETAKSIGTTAESETTNPALGPGARFEGLTRADAEQVIAELRRRGKLAVADQVRTMLRDLAASHGAGPFAEPTAAAAFLVPTARGARSAIMLRMPDGSESPGWLGLIATAKANGFPASTIEFLTWFGVYITLPAEEMLRRMDEFPPRLKQHRLQPSTLEGVRAQCLRAWMGAAVYEAGLDPTTLTPQVLFGSASKTITKALLGWWNRRRAAAGEGAVGTAIAGALPRYLVGAGMTAYTLYGRLRFERDQEVATRESKSGRTERVDRRGEEGSAKTEDEGAVWACYLHTTGTAEKLVEAAAEKLGVRAEDDAPEFKQIRRILANTPPGYWIRMLRGATVEFRRLKRAGEDDTVAYHRVVQFAWELGTYISTGLRSEEGALLRSDRHPAHDDNGALRRFRLTGLDRKNGSETTVTIHPEYVPEDLHREYLDRTLPFFTTGNHLARGRAVQAHPFLMVNDRGKPYGYRYEDAVAELAKAQRELEAALSAVKSVKERVRLQEAADQQRVAIEGRYARKLRQRAGQHGQRLKRGLYHWAAKLNLLIPETKYEFGLHGLRGACAYAVYVLKGIGACAAYLGDTEKTAEKAYSAIDGSNIDSRVLLPAAASAQAEYERQQRPGTAAGQGKEIATPPAPTLAPPPTEAYGGVLEKRLAGLTDLRLRGLLTDEEFLSQKALAYEQHAELTSLATAARPALRKVS